MEGEQEIAGLRFWDGSAMVRLIDSDQDLNAMLLERCEPGTPLSSLGEREQDFVIANVLRRLWRSSDPAYRFRPLTEMLAAWRDELLSGAERTSDMGLVSAGLMLYQQLPASTPQNVLLATDLHAGNVLRAGREPWLAIDPKPFLGDPAFDATQHLLNCKQRLASARP